MELQLFPPEDTLINCKTPDGQTIAIDAMDLDDMIAELYETRKAIPRKEYLGLMCAKFAEKYGFAMSKRSMDVLLEVKTKILTDIKKNSTEELNPVSSTESNQEQTES